MKLKQILLASTLLSAVLFASCSKDDDNDNDRGPQIDWSKTMQFTIDLTAFPNKSYTIPFDIKGTTPANLVIVWGDGGDSTKIAKGTDLSTPATTALLTHIYGAQKTYEITITSAEIPEQIQMPALKFGNYRTDNENPKKLKTIDSPMLTMGGNFDYCFSGCTGLTQIPATLFAKNTAATKFDDCFKGCTALTGIPEKLFEKNTAATYFYYCFSGCTGLAEIPPMLFAANKVATNFNSCFKDCAALTEIPEKLFEKNTAAKDFSSCFSGCTGLTEIPEKLFEKNTAATDFYSCFLGSTGLAEIPAMLFAANKAARVFTSCFEGCTKAKLNQNIFCNEATESSSRFSGKVAYFQSCFKDCGSTLTAATGGVAPALWSYAMEAISDGGHCFTGVTAVTNVADIPTRWGGTKVVTVP